MAESHVVSGLIAKRAEMAGLIDHHKKELSRIAGDLAHVDATIKLFAPEINLRTMHVKAHRQRNQLFLPGECQRLVLEGFRAADGAALSSRQIADQLASKKGLGADMTVQMQKNALAVLHRLEKVGMVVPAGRDGQAQTWKLV